MLGGKGVRGDASPSSPSETNSKSISGSPKYSLTNEPWLSVFGKFICDCAALVEGDLGEAALDEEE